MSKKLEALLQKRAAIDQEILAAEQLEKRKSQVHKLVFGALERHPLAAQADDAILRDALNKTFSDIAQTLQAAPAA